MVKKRRKEWWRVVIPISIVVIICSGVAGCLFAKAPESPRPKEYQVEASKTIATENVAEIMKGQLEKQDGIEAVAIAAILALTKTKEKYQVSGLTNIVANTAEAIKKADGSAKLLSTLSGQTSKSISDMSIPEYLAYTTALDKVNIQNRETVLKGVSFVKDITAKAISIYSGGGITIAGLITGLLGYKSKNKTKTNVLDKTGTTLVKVMKDNPEVEAKLKPALATLGSELPADIKKLFNETDIV
jgi:hypothetical protein